MFCVTVWFRSEQKNNENTSRDARNRVRAVTDGCEQNHEWHPQYTLIDDVGAPTDTEIAAERKHTADHFDIFEPIRFWAFPGYLAGPLYY